MFLGELFLDAAVGCLGLGATAAPGTPAAGPPGCPGAGGPGATAAPGTPAAGPPGGRRTGSTDISRTLFDSGPSSSSQMLLLLLLSSSHPGLSPGKVSFTAAGPLCVEALALA